MSTEIVAALEPVVAALERFGIEYSVVGDPRWTLDRALAEARS
jgi:hypothetical protein